MLSAAGCHVSVRLGRVLFRDYARPNAEACVRGFQHCEAIHSIRVLLAADAALCCLLLVVMFQCGLGTYCLETMHTLKQKHVCEALNTVKLFTRPESCRANNAQNYLQDSQTGRDRERERETERERDTAQGHITQC